MVLTNWDHTMVSVQKLDSGIKTFADNGIIFELGGRHDAWGTTNALGYFGINYIELVNVFDAQKANSFTRSSSSSAYDAVQDFNHQREQLNTVAIRTNDLEGIRQRLKQAGIAVGQILEGDRVDKQNQLIKWKTFFIDDDIEGLPYPFFIDWQQADTDRVVQLEKQGLIQQHPAGKLNVIKAVFEVNEPQKVSQQWANLIESFVIKKDGKFIVPIQDKIFEFVQGDANHLIALHISGAQSELHQKTISLGDAKFVFE